MCIIVYKPQGRMLPSLDTLRACWDNNPDGAGIMWPDGEQVNIRKGFMTWPDFLKALDDVTSGIDVEGVPMALHFRIATHGAVVPGCCHPFAVKDSFDKMRYFVKPNLMQLNASYFVTDPKGTLISDMGRLFAAPAFVALAALPAAIASLEAAAFDAAPLAPAFDVACAPLALDVPFAAFADLPFADSPDADLRASFAFL